MPLSGEGHSRRLLPQGFRRMYLCPMWQKGQQVRFLDEPGGGIVLAVSADRIRVLRDDGFEDDYRPDELVAAGELPLGGWSAPAPAQNPSRESGSKQTRADKAERKPGEWEIDLHFDQLVDYPKNYLPHQKLEKQLRVAQNALDRARRSGVKRVILIHGVGQGRLKEAVHQMLERRDGLRFYDASFARYGQGATEVELY